MLTGGGAGPWRLSWRAFRRDRWSVVAACLLVGLFLASFVGGPLASRALGHSSTDLFPYAVDGNLRPVGPWTRVSAVNQAAVADDGTLLPPPRAKGRTLLVLGADGPLGRDEFLRLLVGARTSLEIALGGVLIALLIGAPLGLAGGYFGGKVGALISRLTEVVMAFPLIFFLVMISVRVSGSLNPIGLGSAIPPGVFAVALLIGLFTWFYPARLLRAEALVLRGSEFVEAARMVGSSDWRILRRHLTPHVLPTIVVWATVAAGTNLLLEVGISFLGAGVQASTATWGSMLATTWGTIFSPHAYDAQTYTPWLTIIPTAAILVAVIALNQVGEGIRRAIDPKARR